MIILLDFEKDKYGPWVMTHMVNVESKWDKEKLSLPSVKEEYLIPLKSYISHNEAQSLENKKNSSRILSLSGFR